MAQALNATTQDPDLRQRGDGDQRSIIAANNAMAQIAFINNQLQNLARPMRRPRRRWTSAISTSPSCRADGH
jgi:hypothetical protein